MAVMSRLAGSGFGKKWKVPFLPEMAIAVICALFMVHWAVNEYWDFWHYQYVLGTWYYLTGLFLAVMAWVYAWFQTGHSDALPIGKQPDNKPLRNNTLTKPTNWIAKKLKIERDTTPYDLIFLSLKGGLITLPFCGTGFILYPLTWWFGEQSPWKPDITRDLFTGASLGISIIIFNNVM